MYIIQGKKNKGGLLNMTGRFLLLACLQFIYNSIFAQRIPVVVHIVSNNPDAVTDAQIFNAIQDLNDAFAHNGIYSLGPGANTGINFCLARKDPNGGNTSGITRTKSVLSDFDADIENGRLKNLISWDSKQYCNIWYVENIEEEIFPMYNCGKWTRMKEGGYATFSGGGNYLDGIVVTGFGSLLAHEMGHYLGLLHTFTIGSCANNNCATDGDGVCDTPPSSVFGGSITTPQNSCSSDTLSGFAIDVPDLNANFMSYSVGTTMFTEGQATKMRNAINTTRNSLLADDKCDPPCGENILAGFNRDNWMPVTGSTINFTSTSTGGTNFQWTVNGVITGGNNPTLNHQFPSNGKYSVMLKVYNVNPACFASYTGDVLISCGVMARFYPDKRIIASKAPVLVDTILFTNRSENANSYEWLMSNNQGMTEQVVSTDLSLSYAFQIPGMYKVRLIAINGLCRDTTETFNFSVEDPTVDGTLNFSSVQCFQQTSVRVSFSVCNSGYATIPAGTPISFYDIDPRLPGAIKLDSTFILPDSVLGKCCGKTYTLNLNVQRLGLNTIYAVFNDRGVSLPVQLPNTTLPELNFVNNFTMVSGFKFTVSINPPNSILEPGDTLRLTGNAGPGSIASYKWNPSEWISCTDCKTPIFIAGKEDVRYRLIAVSNFGCIDSAFTNIYVPPADDYSIKINDVDCYRSDSLRAEFTICNEFKRGIIPANLKVSFYDADPATGTANLLGPVFNINAAANTSCNSYIHIFKGPAPTSIYAVVNDRGVVPFKLPNDSLFLEKNYNNNVTSFSYKADSIILAPQDTLVLRNQTLPVSILSTVYDPASINWLQGTGYSLSCNNCTTALVTVLGNSILRVKMVSQYGCTISGTARMQVIPPDMVIDILDTRCYTNDQTIVSFKLCMNNAYDSILKGIPVSFYDANPTAGRATLLGNTFRTKVARPGNCDTFSAIIRTPGNGNIYAVVNDKGGSIFPDTVYAETDFSNNMDTAKSKIFSATITPADTTIYRTANIQLQADVNGGILSSFNWNPAQYLSCTNCLSPFAKPPYTQEYIFTAKNEYGCTAEASALVRTFTDGKVHIPNAFTPNGDAKNDIFYILGSQEISLVKEFSIYNRYGQRIFYKTNVPPNNPVYGWNGTFGGKELASGTFVYVVNIEFRDKHLELYKGNITLIR